MVNDGHNGLSLERTKYILYNLIEHIPLTPIMDTDDTWDIPEIDSDSNRRCYQCKRLTSLFKYVYNDGSIKYFDTGRFQCIDIGNDTFPYYSSTVSKIMNDMFPFSMPYVQKPFKVYINKFLYDPKNGDVDTFHLIYMIDSDDNKIDLNRYFKISDDSDNGYIELNIFEYNHRKRCYSRRKGHKR